MNNISGYSPTVSYGSLRQSKSQTPIANNLPIAMSNGTPEMYFGRRTKDKTSGTPLNLLLATALGLGGVLGIPGAAHAAENIKAKHSISSQVSAADSDVVGKLKRGHSDSSEVYGKDAKIHVERSSGPYVVLKGNKIWGDFETEFYIPQSLQNAGVRSVRPELNSAVYKVITDRYNTHSLIDLRRHGYKAQVNLTGLRTVNSRQHPAQGILTSVTQVPPSQVPGIPNEHIKAAYRCTVGTKGIRRGTIDQIGMIVVITDRALPLG